MEAKELRIGNLLDFGGGASPINGGGIMLLSEGRLNVVPKPIPLTEEWLVKFGFDNRLLKKIGDTDLYLQADCKESLKEYGLYLSTDIGNGSCNDPNTFIGGYFYVHQLQNLYFALTQKELKIK